MKMWFELFLLVSFLVHFLKKSQRYDTLEEITKKLRVSEAELHRAMLSKESELSVLKDQLAQAAGRLGSVSARHQNSVSAQAALEESVSILQKCCFMSMKTISQHYKQAII